MILAAPFHVPKMSLGLFRVGSPWYCQSPCRGFAEARSVMNSEGRIGRPQSGSPVQTFVSFPSLVLIPVCGSCALAALPESTAPIGVTGLDLGGLVATKN